MGHREALHWSCGTYARVLDPRDSCVCASWCHRAHGSEDELYEREAGRSAHSYCLSAFTRNELLLYALRGFRQGSRVPDWEGSVDRCSCQRIKRAVEHHHRPTAT